MKKNILCLFLVSVIHLIPVQADKQNPLSLLSKPGHYALMRHALAPGGGDPANFDLEDCGTQRNLSEEGRKQAVETGIQFREAGIKKAEILTSQWCRCRDTAKLLQLGEVKELSAINSFFQRPRQRESRLNELEKWFETHEWERPTILVTHQVVITALTDIFPASGETIIVRRNEDGTFEVMARVSAQ